MPKSEAPSVLTRGSAPYGTFDIPEEGLEVPEAQSFLSRFRSSRWKQQTTPVRAHNASVDSLSFPVKPPPPTPTSSAALTKPDVSLISAAVASLELESSPADAKDENELLAGEVEERETLSERSERSSSLPNGNITDSVEDCQPEQGNLEQAIEEDVVAGGAHSKALEEAADEAEDTLIEVIPLEDSLMNESRPSYPILRFCASNALLDQTSLDAMGLPLGFVWSPFGELSNVSHISRAANRCGTCGSFMAKGNGGEDVMAGARFWTCGFCGRNDNDAGQAASLASEKPEDYPELTKDTVEYAHADPVPLSSAGGGAVIIIVDENIEEEEAEWTRAAVAAVHASATDSGLRFCLISVGAGSSVAVRNSTDAPPVPVLEPMSVARASKLTPEEKECFFLGPPIADEEEPTTEARETDLYPTDTNAFINARAPPSLASVGSQLASAQQQESGADPSHKNRLCYEREPRRLDVAISIAFELISGMADGENSRILSLITGPPTLAEHALRRNYIDKDGQMQTAPPPNEAEFDDALGKLYEQIGSKAGDRRIALDFLCFGASQGFAGPILLGAAKRSRGGLVYAAAHSFSAASALAEAASFLAQRSTSPGVVSIRVSSPLVVARVIGPAFPTAAAHTYAVPGIDPTAGFTVILLPMPGVEKETDVPSHAIVQLAAKSLASTRVVTARIPVTRSSTEYLSALDAEICALVLGKACVVTGGGLTQPLVAAKSIDLTALRLLQGSELSAGVVRLLFELRRGLLIERQVHPDCALVLRSFFLRTDCTVASLLMSPRLFTNVMSDERTGLMAEVPLDKSYIVDDAVLVLDTGLNVFVYVGNGASPEAEKAISESARSVAAQRVSPCQLWKLRPGPDVEYLLDSYLSPSSAELRKLQPGKDGTLPSAMEMSFMQYCTMLAPNSNTVQLLQEG